MTTKTDDLLDAVAIAADAVKRERLASKLARIANKIGDKEPIQHGKGIKFPYHAAKDVYGWWRPLLQAESIIIVPEVLSFEVTAHTIPRSESGSRHTFLTNVLARFTVYDGITGETISGTSLGQGEDPSDKGAGKAMTYAEKVFLLGVGMNGSDSDVEATPDDDRDGRGVRVSESNIEGIQRGGRAKNATDAQVKRVRTLARDLGWGVTQTASFITETLGDTIEFPPDDDDPGPRLVAYLESLSSVDIGKLVTAMAEQKRGDDDGTGGY